MYLDGGVEPAAAFIERQIGPLVADVRQPVLRARSQVDAAGAAAGARPPAAQYRIIERERPRPPEELPGRRGRRRRGAATGIGRTKKEAEQEAARLALAALEPSRR